MFKIVIGHIKILLLKSYVSTYYWFKYLCVCTSIQNKINIRFLIFIVICSLRGIHIVTYLVNK